MQNWRGRLPASLPQESVRRLKSGTLGAHWVSPSDPATTAGPRRPWSGMGDQRTEQQDGQQTKANLGGDGPVPPPG